MMESVDS